ncbi:MAG: diguanylate cyclase [Chloroflexi bacterium]|nr:MAG: diguanylate cyclase [Chloroflexota bacterium]
MPTKFSQAALNLFYLLFAAGSFFLLLAGLVYPLTPSGYSLPLWQHNQDDAWKDVQMPYIERVGPGITTKVLRTSFPYIDADTLIIPRQSGNAVEVRLNDRVIYKLGDPAQPTANLWNFVQMVILPEPLQSSNQLEISITSSYFSTGINGIPFLTNYEQAAGRVMLLNWLYNDFLLFASGAALILSVILIVLVFSRRKSHNAELFMGLALLFGVIYIQDMQFRLTTGDLAMFLWVKKGIMVSGYLGTLCFICGLESYHWKRVKTGRWIAVITGISAAAILAASDLYSLAILLDYTNLIFIFNIVIMVIVLLRGKKNPSWMLLPAAWIIFSLLQMVLAIPLGITWPLMSSYALLLTIILIGVKLVIEYNQLFQENIDLERAKNRDPLTGVMNRSYLTQFKGNTQGYLVMIDLDFFKGVNDKYGHTFGDQLLVQFVDVATQNIRKKDLVVRLGGDEFVFILDYVILPPAGFEEVERILQRIQSQYSALHAGITLEFSYGIAPLDGSIENSLEIADKRMYQMKEKKKQLNS